MDARPNWMKKAETDRDEAAATTDRLVSKAKSIASSQDDASLTLAVLALVHEIRALRFEVASSVQIAGSTTTEIEGPVYVCRD